MPRLKWEKPDERTCCYSADKDKHFYGSYWKNSGKWYAHINLREFFWYIREFPLETSEKEIKKECQKLINHFSKEKDKWQMD